MNTIIKNNVHVGILIARLCVGAIFVVQGIAKYNMGMDVVSGFFGGAGIPMPLVMAWVVTLVEVVGGALLILGVFTEISALLLIATMLGAIGFVTWGMGFSAGYQGNLAIIAALIPFVTFGAGKYSLQALFTTKPQQVQSM